MADSSIDYTVVLADLRAKRDQLETAIAAIEAMLGMTASAPGHAPAGTPATGGELGPGAFLGMSIVDATVKLLSIRRQQTRTEDIAAALKQGGIAFSSDNPANTVGSVLNRNFTQGGEIVRVGRGVWGLAEWHPRLRKKRPQNGGMDQDTESMISAADGVPPDELATPDDPTEVS